MSKWWESDPATAPAQTAIPQSKWWESDPAIKVEPPKAPPRPGQAQAATTDVVTRPKTENSPGIGSAFMTGFENIFSGAQQGTNPNVYHGDGADLRKRLTGAVVEDDGGNKWLNQDGKLVPLNTKDHVVLKDPASGELAAFERTPQWDEGRLAGFSRIATQGLMTGPVVGPQRGVGAAAASTRAAQRANQIEQEAAAFDRLGVRQFPAGFAEGPTASVAKQLSETPLVGAPLRQNLQESIEGTAAAANRVADAIAPAATQELAGARMQRALDRYRNAGIADVEPPQLDALNVTTTRPVRPADVMSNAAAQRAQQAEPLRQQLGAFETQTTRGAPVQSARTRQQTLTARTRAEDLSDAELTSVIRAPSSDTSFGAKSEALYERAWRMIPSISRSDGSANPNMINAVNTRQALRGIEDNIASNIAGQGTLNGALAERITNPRSNFTLSDLRAIRTEIGRAMGNPNPLQKSLSDSQLKGLYGAVSRDIEIGLEDLANRAALGTQRSNNAPDYVAPEVARQAAGALRAFRTADRYFRQGVNGIQRFSQIVGTDNPTRAVENLLSAAKGRGRGNMTLLRTARNALRPEEWSDIQSLMIRKMGVPVGSARGMTEDAGFSVSSFLTTYNNMEPSARNLLFGGEHARAINDLVTVVRKLANVEATTNFSRSGTNTINLAGGAGALASLGVGDVVTPALIGGGGFAASVMLSKPAYTRWLTTYLRLKSASSSNKAAQGRLATQINVLQQMARNNPELMAVYRSIAAENGISEDSGE